jgi:hypothetical protein
VAAVIAADVYRVLGGTLNNRSMPASYDGWRYSASHPHNFPPSVSMGQNKIPHDDFWNRDQTARGKDKSAGYKARRTCPDEVGIPELSTVQCEHILQHKLAWIALGTVDVPLNIETKASPAFLLKNLRNGA